MGDGRTLSVHQQVAIAPFFPDPSGYVSLPPEPGGIEHRPVNGLPSPGNVFRVVVFGKARLPQRLKEPRLAPLVNF